MRHHLHAALLLALIALPAGAQEPARMRARTRSGTVIISNGERTDTVHFDSRRGRMGINVDMRSDPGRDSIGAGVVGVTPGSPAYRAGVQIGDIITRFNGTPLVASDGRPNEEDDQSRPAMRLINLASRLNQGDTVRLDLRREGRSLSVTVVAAESDVDELVDRLHLPGMMDFGGAMLRGGPGRMFTMMGGPLSSLELVKVNAGLGEYFGTQEGLLVVDVGEDTALGLRAGDVVLSIGGRRPASPPQAMRILGTYEANEAVQFEVMRQRHRATVSGKMPARRERAWRIQPNNFDFEMFREPAERMRRMLENQLPRRGPRFELMLPRREIERARKIRLEGET